MDCVLCVFLDQSFPVCPHARLSVTFLKAGYGSFQSTDRISNLTVIIQSNLLEACKEQLRCASFLNVTCQAFNHPSFTNEFLLSVFRDDSKIKKQDTPALCDLHCCKDGLMRNGLIGQKEPSINPERLKDFGEEDYLNGDVKTWEMKIVSRNEELLRDALSRIPQSSSRTSLSSSNKLIRFEDISAAAFKIQCGVQKTPCMVGTLYGFALSKYFFSL